MTEQVLARARAGDEDAFRELTDPYRRELQLHVYRIVGSAQDAEDLLQETLLAAWRGLERFEERASVRAWLYRIATNRSLDALRASRRRPEDLPRLTEMPEPTRRAESIWLEPYPDVLLEGIPDQAPGPEARYETKEAIALAFIVGLQHLPPQQRAVLVLRDVLGFRAEEVAKMLDTTATSVNSLLRRARAAFESRLPAAGRERAPLPDSKSERDAVGSFADAIEAGDIDAMVALLTDDAWLTMPPEPSEYQGPDRDRRVPARPRGPARRAAAAGANACKRPARVRLLPPHPQYRHRAAARTVRPHARRRPDLRDHLVRRHQRLSPVRTAADAAVRRVLRRSVAAGEHEHRNPSCGLGLVLAERRRRGDEFGPQRVVGGGFEFLCARCERLGADLDFDHWIRLEVVVPAWVGRGSSVGGDDHVAAISVGPVGQRCDALDPGPGADVAEEKQRSARQRAADASAVRAELLDDPVVEVLRAAPAIVAALRTAVDGRRCQAVGEVDAV